MPRVALEQLMLSFGGLTGVSMEIEDLDRSRGEESLLEKIEDADILIGDFTFQVPITEKAVNQAKALKLIQQPSAGYQQIDLKACERKGIPVCNTGSANAEAVAEFTVMAALFLLKNARLYSLRLQEKKWTDPLSIQSRELKEKNICILGLGRIGREVARRFKPFGARLFYYDLYRNEAAEEELGIKYVGLDELIQKADVFTVHLPLTSKTKDLIGTERLKKFKASCVLVQVARGGVVNEQALTQALRENALAAAWVDVFQDEPLPVNSPFYDCPNLVMTPHMAGVTEEARQRIVQAAMSNIARCIKGEELKDLVRSYE